MILYVVTDLDGSFEDFHEDVSFNLEEEFGLAAGFTGPHLGNPSRYHLR